MKVTDYTAPFSEQILADARTLGILPARSYPLATQYIPQMVAWVEKLEQGGLAYSAEDGSVYFAIGSFPTYGCLKGLDPDASRPGARVARTTTTRRTCGISLFGKAASRSTSRSGPRGTRRGAADVPVGTWSARS